MREGESSATPDAGVFLPWGHPPEKSGEQSTRHLWATTSAQVGRWPRSACSSGELTNRDVFRVSSGGGSPSGTSAKTMLRRENPHTCSSLAKPEESLKWLRIQGIRALTFGGPLHPCRFFAPFRLGSCGRVRSHLYLALFGGRRRDAWYARPRASARIYRRRRFSVGTTTMETT